MGLSWDWGLGGRAGRGLNDYGQARPRCSIGHIGVEKAPRPGGARSVTGLTGALVTLPAGTGQERRGQVRPEILEQPT